MAKWMQSKPEAAAWLRLQYDDGDIPDWVGKFKDENDYAAFLTGKGVPLPDGFNSGSMDESDPDPDSGSDDNPEDADIGEVTPVQEHTVGDVWEKSGAPRSEQPKPAVVSQTQPEIIIRQTQKSTQDRGTDRHRQETARPTKKIQNLHRNGRE
jgi:hypothetical protein